MAYLASDVFFYEQIFALVVEDYVDFLGAWTADIWAKHDVVWTVSMHAWLVDFAAEDFGIATTAVDVLFMLHCELNDQGLALVVEGLLEFGRNSVESGILGSL